MSIGSLESLLHSLGSAAQTTHFRAPAQGFESALEALEAPEEAAEPGGADDATGGETSETLRRLFRGESFVTEVAERRDQAESYQQIVLGPEAIAVEEVETQVEGNLTERHGARDRTARRYERSTGEEEFTLVGERVEERVEGRTILTAAYTAEAMVAGAYVNVITGAYLRSAGWVDAMAWGGWIEADAIRMEMALLMVRSHVGYAHASGARIVAASRLVDDFVARTENFGVFLDNGTNELSIGGPGSGIDNSA